MDKLKLRSPIPKKYSDINRYCLINQFFGENLAIFYKQLGLKGHNGLDFLTKRFAKWQGDKRIATSKEEKAGMIPILATHDGWLYDDYNDDLTRGVGMEIMSAPVLVNGKECKVKTVYFHLKKLRRWRGDGKQDSFGKGKDFVKAGTIIGWSDNSGKYTTGAHLHFGLRPYWKKGNKYVADTDDGYWGYIDPLPFLIGKFKRRTLIV